MRFSLQNTLYATQRLGEFSPGRRFAARFWAFFAILVAFSLPSTLFGQVLVFDPAALSTSSSETLSETLEETPISVTPFSGVRTASYNASQLFSPPISSLNGESSQVVFASPHRASAPSPILLVQSAGGATPFTPPGSGAPSYAPGAGSISPGTAPGFSNSGNPNWDPYARPGGGGSLFNSQASSEFFDKVPEHSKFVAKRFIEKVSLDYTFIPGGNDDKSFGINELAYQTEFFFPTCFLPDKAPIYIVPGINLYWWDGPRGLPYSRHDMAASGYGAYLESGSAFSVTENFAVELWARLGVYSDFNKVTSDSVRFSGQGSVVVGLTKEIQGVFGIVYLNRERIKMLPRIGVIWKPNNEVVWQLVFPNPKLSRYITKINNMDWWFYLSGDYAGGTWAISEGAGSTFLTDYNDIRLGLGLEFTNNSMINGYVEFGGAFGRELYAEGTAWCKPPSAIYLKAGFHF